MSRPTVSTALICTVGGSHQPVVQAINSLQPDFICFVCTGDDSATGQPGSRRQVEGNGNVIKANTKDEKPGLPNIPAQLNLSDEAWEVLEVEPDDFDDIYRKVHDWLIKQAANDVQLIADYTGGTKTMSAALVVAALDQGDVRLQLVTGTRASLIRVERGTESALFASVTTTRAKRAADQALMNWRAYAYAEATQGLRQIQIPQDKRESARIRQSLALSQAFSAWDRFDHAHALEILQPFRPVLGKQMHEHFQVLGLLTNDSPRRELMRLFDLWRNAQRRGVQHRYDDAVARLYRLSEWSAQWLLREQTGIDTADVPVEKIPDGIVLPANGRGQHQAGLVVAWELAAFHCGERARQFWDEQKSVLLNLLQSRNYSILAHGLNPLSETEYKDFLAWVEKHLLKMLLVYAEKAPYRVKSLPPQLLQDFIAP